MSMLKKAAFAASFAVLSSGVAASGALAAGPTTVSYSTATSSSMPALARRTASS